MSQLPPQDPQAPSSRSYLALGLTFLLLGVGFACPWRLAVRFPAGMWEGQIATDVLNLYALTAFLGWAHFAYAWQGQWRASGTWLPTRRAGYWAAVVMLLAALIVLRRVMGVAVFSLVVWVYNIAHFIKAESAFAGPRKSRASGTYYAPAVAFAWFTLTLFQVGPLEKLTVVYAGSLLLAGLTLALGDWRALAQGDAPLPMLTLFLLGEAMVWAEYSPFMTPAFRVGIYVVHIAAASFFHYLGSYFFAQRGAKTPLLLRPWMVVLVNAVFVMAGVAVDRIPALWPLRYVLSPEWFTLWVALHLAASDLLPQWKRRQRAGEGTLTPVRTNGATG